MEANLSTNRNGNKFQFTGEGSKFFLIILKTFFLSIITLGIYYFWGKVNIQKYLYNNTKFQDGNFDFHATGKELFLGFLKSALIIIVLSSVYLGAIFIGAKIHQSIALVLPLILYIGIFGLIPFFIIASLRFRYNRTSFRGIRFQFLGDLKILTILFLKGILLTMISLGIYSPWFSASLTKYIAENSIFGNHAFESKIDGKVLFFMYLKGIALSIITVGIYSFWFRAELFRYRWNNYFFQNGKIHSNLTGLDLFIATLKAFALIIFTLGIGSAWAIMILHRTYIDSLSFSEEIDFSKIQTIAVNRASSTLETLSDNIADSLGPI
jgi:uncharacterized membrane protein YjgN (DUF898 family)